MNPKHPSLRQKTKLQMDAILTSDKAHVIDIKVSQTRITIWETRKVWTSWSNGIPQECWETTANGIESKSLCIQCTSCSTSRAYLKLWCGADLCKLPIEGTHRQTRKFVGSISHCQSPSKADGEFGL
jgi:hypothetical protein